MKNVLILCTGNSCRSQIAHGYLAQMLQDKAEVYSAGIETHGVNPRAIQVMREDGVDISHHSSNNINEYLGMPLEHVITVCDHAKENCPFIPGATHYHHHNFPDPAKATGTEAEIMQAFTAVREMIKDYCQSFTQTYFSDEHLTPST
jgi:arsenate reductase (thioredoxin)